MLAAPKFGANMEVRTVSHVLLEDAFIEVDRQLTTTGLRQCLDHIVHEYGEDDGTGIAMVERIGALMRVSHAEPVRRFVRAVGGRHEFPRAFMVVAACAPLPEGGDFDPASFEEAVLFAMPAEGEA